MDSVMNLYLNRCKKKRLNANIPCIIQEIYNPTTVNFLPDEYKGLTTTAIKPWSKLYKAPLYSGRGIDMECDPCGDDWEPPPAVKYDAEVCV